MRTLCPRMQEKTRQASGGTDQEQLGAALAAGAAPHAENCLASGGTVQQLQQEGQWWPRCHDMGMGENHLTELLHATRAWLHTQIIEAAKVRQQSAPSLLCELFPISTETNERIAASSSNHHRLTIKP